MSLDTAKTIVEFTAQQVKEIIAAYINNNSAMSSVSPAKAENVKFDVSAGFDSGREYSAPALLFAKVEIAVALKNNKRSGTESMGPG